MNTVDLINVERNGRLASKSNRQAGGGTSEANVFSLSL